MRVTVDGLDLSTPLGGDDENRVTLADLIAAEVGRSMVAQGIAELESLRERVRGIRDEQIREQVAAEVREALHGVPSHVPVTLAEVIRVEAWQQIHRGDLYQGTSTPLKQVVAALVYDQLHAEADALVKDARDKIREQVREEIATIVSRNFRTLE